MFSLTRGRLVATTVLASAGLTIGVPATAYAAPAHPAVSAHSSYDYTDPIQTGCANDARTVRSHRVFLGSTVVGNIELRYSAHCRTIWSRVTRYSSSSVCHAPNGVQAYCIQTEIIRNSDGAQGFPSGGACWGNSCYTAQLNDAGVTSFATGSIWSQTAENYVHGTTVSY